MDKKTTMLMILDGFGINEKEEGNAIKMANIPNIKRILKQYPNTILHTSGLDVGLPEGQMGNSEVGHTNIGAGRIVYQELTRITKSIEDGDFFSIPELVTAIENCKKNHSKLHIMGLVSDGGVHSHQRHLFALLELAKRKDFEDVYVHCFLDGRDTPPASAEGYLAELEAKMSEKGVGKIATIMGRFYAMDRDNRWDRIEKAYNAIVNGEGMQFNNYHELVDYTNENNITDEFVVPAVIDKNATLKDNDGLIVFNFRPDRIRELFMAITNPNFKEFPVKHFNNIKLTTMMHVSDDLVSTQAFPNENMLNTFGEYISNKNLTQLRIAETEKYAHVTYFFDGGVEKDLPGCKRILIPSPKVATYDLKPEMSANEITDKLLEVVDNYDVVILNFANCDMVGHTGNMEATIKAIETVDKNIGRIFAKANELNATMLITADHGNCDIMLDDNNNVITSHTTSPVPFIVTDKNIKLKNGKLGDIAPTMLEILGLEQPVEMTGESLIEK